MTGGWNISLQNNGSGSNIQFLEDKIYMTTTSAAYWGHYVNTINRIDLRKYQNLCIKYSSSTKYYSADWYGNYILISIIDQEENTSIIAKINPSTDEIVEKIDISGISDSYKIRINGGSIYFLNVYEVWLE